MNNWNIPEWLEKEVLARDNAYVYCGVTFHSSKESRITRASWEHIINDASIVTSENIARVNYLASIILIGEIYFQEIKQD